MKIDEEERNKAGKILTRLIRTINYSTFPEHDTVCNHV